MSSSSAAPGAAASNAAASLTAMLSPARAEASRKNGARSKGPKTPEGKARSAQNALKHGLRARKWVVLYGESEAEFKRLEAALVEELAPEGVLQSLLAQRVAAAAWRLGRAEQIETQLFAENSQGARALGLALIRDCNGARAFDTLLRYRGGTLAELWRALRTLKALQAEAGEATAQQDAGTAPAPSRAAVPAAPAPMLRAPAPALAVRPDEPESLENSGDSGRASNPPEQNAAPSLDLARLPLPARGGRATPIEPESRRNLGQSAPQPAAEIAKNGRASLLAGTALARPPAASLGSTGG